jgi:hypothetical protein
VEDSTQERLETARRLLARCEQAHSLAAELHREIIRIRDWAPATQGVTPLRYSLGISHGDIEIAANRLAGLQNELQQLVRLLEEEAENERIT